MSTITVQGNTQSHTPINQKYGEYLLSIVHQTVKELNLTKTVKWNPDLRLGWNKSSDKDKGPNVTLGEGWYVKVIVQGVPVNLFTRESVYGFLHCLRNPESFFVLTPVEGDRVSVSHRFTGTEYGTYHKDLVQGWIKDQVNITTTPVVKKIVPPTSDLKLDIPTTETITPSPVKTGGSTKTEVEVLNQKVENLTELLTKVLGSLQKPE